MNRQSWKARREPWKRPKDDHRSQYGVDYARVIHSFAFRRLQAKSQILNLGESDFYRTRLTHSIEVSQIAVGLAKSLRRTQPSTRELLPKQPLLQTAGLIHDLGHPPFGHGGEKALNFCMKDHGGFEGNAQTIRILTKLEDFSDSQGANLTRRTLLAAIKYPANLSNLTNRKIYPDVSSLQDSATDREISKFSPAKGYYDCDEKEISWLLEPLSTADRKKFQEIEREPGKHAKSIHKTFDATITDLADDIAYGVHDLEDAIAMNLVDRAVFESRFDKNLLEPFLAFLDENYEREVPHKREDFVNDLFSGGEKRKKTIGRLVKFLVARVTTQEVGGFNENSLKQRVGLPGDAKRILKALKAFVSDHVIKSPSVQHLEFKGQIMVRAVFEVYASEPKRFLPDYAYSRYERSDDKVRAVCDHVAGMTDIHLMRMYERLFAPRVGSVLQVL